MNSLLRTWRETTIIVLATLLGMASYGMQLAKGRRNDAAKQASELQARYDDAVSRELGFTAQLADKDRELRAWIDSTSEQELKMVQECIRVQTELNAYVDHFGPLPLKFADREHP